MNVYIKNLIRFCIIMIIQILVFRDEAVQWWAEPNGFPIFKPIIYPLFILLLPFETPVWALILLGFVSGIVVDASMNTAGMHAFATVLIAYFRTNVLNALLPKNLGEYGNQSPSVKNMGWLPYIVYAAFLIVFHHATFFVFELWNVGNISYLLLKILVTTITSLLFVLAYALLFTRQSKQY